MALYLQGFVLENTFFSIVSRVNRFSRVFLHPFRLEIVFVRSSCKHMACARSQYQMFGTHGPPWIVHIETEYILGISRFRRIGYLCGKRNIYVKSLAFWV